MYFVMKEAGGLMESITYDTDVEDTSTMNRIMRSVVGESFNARINNDGSVVAVSGIEEMFERTLSKLPDMDWERKMEVVELLQNQYGEEQLMQNLQYLATLPEEGVAVNDSWQDTISMNDIQAVFVTTYTVKEINDDYVILDVKGIVDSPKSPTNGEDEDSIEMSGDIAYEQRVDRNTGWIKSMDGDIGVKMLMKNMGMEMPSQLNFTLKGWSGK
jgi:CRISPR/Cas system-associated exonuclease Cas4 (RecB family)